MHVSTNTCQRSRSSEGQGQIKRNIFFVFYNSFVSCIVQIVVLRLKGFLVSVYYLFVPIRYVKAKHSPGDLVLDGPQMDIESGEMIVTLAKTLMMRYFSLSEHNSKLRPHMISKCIEVC